LNTININDSKVNDPLRVTFLSHSAFKGNAEIGLLNLIKELSYRNVKCHVILPQDGWLSKELIKVSVPFDVVSFPWWTYNLNDFYRDLWKDVIESSAKIADIIYNNLSDIVFTNTIYIPQGAIIADFFKIPHIWHISDFEETIDNIYFLLDFSDRTKFIYNYSKKILFGSEAIQSFFHQFINSNKSILCPYKIYSYNSATDSSNNIYNLMLNLNQRQRMESKSINIPKEFMICYYQIIDSLKFNIAEKDNIIVQQDHIIAQKDNIISQKDHTISNLLSSRSWRITSPLRQLYDLLHNLQRNDPLNKTLKNKEKRTDSADKIPEIKFPETPEPIVSIIIPVYNNWRNTYACLNSIRESSVDALPCEIIIVDDASTDETQTMLAHIKGVQNLLNNKSLGFLGCCNKAAKQARGRFVLFCNNDNETQAAWLEPLVRFLEKYAKTCITGSKLSPPNGNLREAGGILWNDGGARLFGWAADSEKPDYHYIQEANYCSGASILFRREFWNQAGDFNEQFKQNIFKEYIICYFQFINSLKNIVANKDHIISNKNNIIDSKDNLIACKERSILSLTSSLSWKLTGPLRRLDNFIRDIRSNDALNKYLLPQIHNNIPLPKFLKKQPSKFITHNVKDFTGIQSTAVDWAASVQPVATFLEKLTALADKIPEINFPETPEPVVSIIIPVYNNWRYTYACLQAIRERSGHALSYEVIIADDGSSDDTTKMLACVHGITVIHNEQNLGFLRNCNKAAHQARGHYIIFLNNDTEVQPDWLEPLYDIWGRFSKVGMVGGKLLFADGRVQEAGGIILQNGWGHPYGRGAKPDSYEFNYVKEVDCLIGACIMVERDLFLSLGGFDESFAPAFYEEFDLAFSLRQLGYKIIYQPASRIVHFDASSYGAEVRNQRSEINHKKFLEKWQAVLTRHAPSEEDLFLARDRSQDKPIILVIDDTVPVYDKHAGGLVIHQYVRLFLDMGYKVIYLPDDRQPMEPYTSELQQAGVEVLYGAIDFEAWLARNGKYLHYVWLARPQVSIKYIDHLKNLTHARLLYFTHDLHFLRERRHYEFDPDPTHLFESQQFKNQEFQIFSKVDVILTPSHYEEQIIRENFPGKRVFTIPLHFYEFPPESSRPGPDFAQREEILFLGGLGHPPNADAVRWFVAEIFPRVKQQLPEVTFTVAGSHPPREILALQREDLRVTGYVPDLGPLFAKSRVFVAPLRFGAGVKGKILTSIVEGVPVVTTSIGDEGLDLANGQEAFIADDPEAFAARTVELYTNQALWESMATKAWDFIQRNFSFQKARHLIEAVILFIDPQDLILHDFVHDIKHHYLNQQAPHDEDFCVFSNFTNRKEVFLDIGANIGISAVSFRLFNREAKIISFEPSPWLKPALEWLKNEEGEKFDYFMYGAGNESVTLELYIPCLNNRPNFYLASFVVDRFGPATEAIQDMRKLLKAQPQDVYTVCKIPVQIKPIDDFGLNPSLVKIDAETFEYQVLQGMQDTISRCRPLIMLEGANRDEKIRSFFSEHAYHFAMRKGNQLTLFDGISTLDNGFFLPLERLDEYRQRAILI
jgi:FkbM family methyltransferase